MLDAAETLADDTDFDSLRIQVGIQIALLGEPFSAELALARPGMCGGSKSALALGNSRGMSGGAPELKMLRFNVPLDKVLLGMVATQLHRTVLFVHHERASVVLRIFVLLSVVFPILVWMVLRNVVVVALR